jgi:hypothetical protein
VPHQELNWGNFAPRKMRVFFWILRLGKTRMRAHLFRLGCVPSSDYPFCPGLLEDVRLMFVQCPRLAAVWALAALGLRLSPAAGLTMLLDGLAEHLPDMQSSPRNTVVLSLLWAVWKSRNHMVFDRDLLAARQVASMAASHLRLWVVHAPRRVDLAPSTCGVITCRSIWCVYSTLPPPPPLLSCCISRVLVTPVCGGLPPSALCNLLFK